MAGHVSRIRTSAQEGPIPFNGYPAASMSRSGDLGLNSSSVTAHSVEFVAKPGDALKAQSALAPAISGTLKGVTGFAGCMVMTADHEARLMTVVTFWRGTDRVKHCNANMRWVNALLTPYIDRKLRAQTMVAQLPAASFLDDATDCSNENASTDPYADLEAEVCVA